MVLDENKFIIFHHGGSGGDFLATIINYLFYKKGYDVNYTNTNQTFLKNNEDYGFKNFCRNLFYNESDDISNYKIHYCMPTHYYHPTLKKIFPDSIMYYIDVTNYEKNVLDRYRKVATMKYKNFIIEQQDKKIYKKFDSDLLNLIRWKNIFIEQNIKPIPITMFFNLDSFKNILKNYFLLDINEKVIDDYNIWLGKNKSFFDIKV